MFQTIFPFLALRSARINEHSLVGTAPHADRQHLALHAVRVLKRFPGKPMDLTVSLLFVLPRQVSDFPMLAALLPISVQHLYMSPSGSGQKRSPGWRRRRGQTSDKRTLCQRRIPSGLSFTESLVCCRKFFGKHAGTLIRPASCGIGYNMAQVNEYITQVVLL